MPLLTARAHAGILVSDNVLTAKQVTALLKVAETTACVMAQADEIPAFKIRGQCRVKRTVIDQSIDARRPRDGEGSIDGRA